MQPAKSFRDLIVWMRAHEFVLQVYRLTKEFPKAELFGLTSQFRRAAISVAANIAEGFKKNSAADKIRILNIAEGSLEECRYYLILTNDLSYGTVGELEKLAEEVSKLLKAYSRAIRSSM